MCGGVHYNIMELCITRLSSDFSLGEAMPRQLCVCLCVCARVCVYVKPYAY